MLGGLGEVERSSKLLEEALAIDTRTYGADHPKVAMALSDIARILRDIKRGDEPVSWLSTADRTEDGEPESDEGDGAALRARLTRMGTQLGGQYGQSSTGRPAHR